MLCSVLIMLPQNQSMALLLCRPWLITMMKSKTEAGERVMPLNRGRDRPSSVTFQNPEPIVTSSRQTEEWNSTEFHIRGGVYRRVLRWEIFQ